ncbi:hypothetical protein WMF39_15245 [Sorangium sp. So ce1504]|uniref:hypothetical protein n=1 Tax=Sorangium sp. So ce1504 TaxID=3133337 RepID=UPI003F61B3F2
MSVLLISYDLNSPGQSYQKLVEYIKKFPSWAKLGQSAYAVLTSETPASVSAAIASIVDKNDTYYVITLARQYSGFGPPDVNNWLESNLPY